MIIEAMKQALDAFEAIMFEKDAESCQLIAKNARYGLRDELAKPEQAEKQQALDKKADNARELGLDYEPTHTDHPMRHWDRTCPACVAQAEKQEPVAWWNGKDGFKRADDVDSVPNWTDYYYIALYTDPTPCKTCEALARTVMMDQTSHDTAPLRKEWVGLTVDEIVEISESEENTGDVWMALNVQARLKEKNT